MSERLILDPPAVADDRVEFELTSIVGEAGPDFGDAAIEAYLAQAERGQLPVDYRIPNRLITVPLIVVDHDALLPSEDLFPSDDLFPGVTVTFAQARRYLQAKVALFQREGGWLKRETAEGVVYADIVGATLKLGAGLYAARGSIDADAVLTLEVLPDWYGEEVALDPISKTVGVSFPEIADVLTLDGEPAVIAGDYAGRCRIAVDEVGGDADQCALFWAYRSRHYDAAATARPVYEAEDLTPLDIAVIDEFANGSWGATVKHPGVANTWTPVLSTTLAAGGDLTHVGSYRVRARVRTTAQLRLVYDVADLTLPTENAPWIPPPATSATQFYIADLGAIRIDEAPIGTHSWRGHIQAKGAAGGEECEIDRIWLQDVTESAGWMSTPFISDVSLASFSIRDAFDQAAGNLATQDLPVGTGAWSGAGDANDFTVEDTGHTARRTAVSDSITALFDASETRNPLHRFSPYTVTYPTGRFGLAGSATFSDVAVQVDVKASADLEAQQGVVLRYTDTDNYLLAVISISGGYVAVIRAADSVISGTILNVVGFAVLPFSTTIDAFYTVRAQADSDGRWAVWAGPQGAATGTPILAGYDSELATQGSGVLDTGKVGIFDGQTSGGANTRTFDNFAAWVPVGNAVAYAAGAVEVRTEGVFREADSGYGYSKITPFGDLPRIPPSGLELRPVELLLKMSRGDLDQLPDSGFDDVTVRVYYRPSWLFIAEAA